MKQEIIKLLLKKDFYLRNKHRVKASMFDDSDLKPLYRTLVNAHEKYEGDLTVDDIAVLYESENPALNRSKLQNVKILLRELANSPPVNEEVAEDVLYRAYQKDIGDTIANIGIGISDGEIHDLQMLKRLIEQANDNFTPLTNIKECTLSAYELFGEDKTEGRWNFNLRALQNKVPGIGPGEFTVVFARPETGKTAYHVSLCYGPGGFAEQGAKIATFVNEEPARKTRGRAMMAWSGVSENELTEPHNLKFMHEEFEKIKDNAYIADTHDITMAEIDAYCETHRPDILVIDQLDHVHIQGTFARTDEKLKEIYAQARQIAVRHNLAIIGLSQAGAEAEGKTRLNPTMMDGSKTGKFAMADLIIGIGRHEYGVDDDPDYTRHLCVGKNKISGWHGTVVCLIEPRVSRYVD